MKHARTDYDERIQDAEGLIPRDEPVMLIRARDVGVLPALDAWLEAVKEHEVADDLIAAVERHRQRIVGWQTEYGLKVPDAPSVVLKDPDAQEEEE